MTVSVSAPRQTAAGQSPSRYDGVTIGLHWTILILVAVQWLGAELVDFTPRPTHKLYWSIHISIGVLFAAAVLFHVLWRLTAGRKLPLSNEEGWKSATLVMHSLLFWLPLILAALGIGIVLARGWTLYNTITIPMMPGGSKHLAGQIHAIHEWTAHVIVFLATGHALAALFHRYVLRDGVLRRMQPGPSKT
jgi:cytochrome b561